MPMKLFWGEHPPHCWGGRRIRQKLSQACSSRRKSFYKYDKAIISEVRDHQLEQNEEKSTGLALLLYKMTQPSKRISHMNTSLLTSTLGPYDYKAKENYNNWETKDVIWQRSLLLNVSDILVQQRFYFPIEVFWEGMPQKPCGKTGAGVITEAEPLHNRFKV